MTRFNPTRIANRTGRIVFATILAGFLVATLSLFNPDGIDPITDVGDIVGVYFEGVFGVAIMTVFLSFIAPPVILIYWGLSNRLSQLRTWQILLVGTVGIASAWAVSENAGAVDIILATLAKTAKGSVVLLSIAAVETLATNDIDLNPRQLATGTGALALVFVVLVPAAAIGAGVVGDEQTERDRLEAAFDTDSKPSTNYVWLSNEHVSVGDSGSANHLIANASQGPTDLSHRYSYNVAETHVGAEYFDLQTYNVKHDGETTAVKGHYYLTFEGESNRSTYYDSILNTDAAEVNMANGTDPYTADVAVPMGDDGTLKMESTESMWVFYDVATEDGEVHRYMVYLERDDV